MLATNLLLKPASGFIAVSPGRATTAPGSTEHGNDVAAAPAHPGASATWATHINERPTWTSSAGSNARKVEMAILASVCAYFAFGLGGALGLY